VQLFDSVKLYVFTFCLGALIAVSKLHQLTKSPAPASTAGFSFENIVTALITILMAIYLPGLLRKLSSRIEQTAIALVEVACVIWLADWLTIFGINWAKIPNIRFLDAAVFCAVTILAGIRTFQVAWFRRNTREA
jgi:hypothetical protein